MAARTRALSCAAALGQASQSLGAGGITFGRPGGCAALQALRRCCSHPPSESPEGEGPGVGTGGPRDDLHVRVGRLELNVELLKEDQKTLTQDVNKLKEVMHKVLTGDSKFVKEMQDDMKAVVRWQQYAVGFTTCASICVAYALFIGT